MRRFSKLWQTLDVLGTFNSKVLRLKQSVPVPLAVLDRQLLNQN
jgi:hypothetical protein